MDADQHLGGSVNPPHKVDATHVEDTAFTEEDVVQLVPDNSLSDIVFTLLALLHGVQNIEETQENVRSERMARGDAEIRAEEVKKRASKFKMLRFDEPQESS